MLMMKRDQKVTPTTAAAALKRMRRLKRRRQQWRRNGRRGAVESKVRKLQRIIPGGQGLLPDLLFLRTADYILHLRLQLNLLQALSKIYF